MMNSILVMPSIRPGLTVKSHYAFAFLTLWLSAILGSNAIPIAIRGPRGLVDEAPIIVKGEVLAIEDFTENTSVFGFEPSFKNRGVTKKAKIRVESVVKGGIAEDEISVLYFDSPGGPFTRLHEGSSYVLFLTHCGQGLRLYDAANGGLRVARGAMTMEQSDLISRLREILNCSLRSRDEHVLQTALLVIAEIGDEETRPALQPFLNHASPRVRAAAVSACLRLGEWQVVTNAIHLLESSAPDLQQTENLDLISLSPLDSLTRSLASVRNTNAVPLLISLLEGSSARSCRVGLLKSLADIGDERAIPVFLTMIDDPDPDTSYLAYRALIRIRGTSSYVAPHALTGERKLRELEELKNWAKGLRERTP